MAPPFDGSGLSGNDEGDELIVPDEYLIPKIFLLMLSTAK